MLRSQEQKASYPPNKKTFVGAGPASLIATYHALEEAEKKGEQLRVSIYEKNKRITDTTSTNIVPSLTPDESLSVVPRGELLLEKLGILFSEPGGIRVEDVADVNDSVAAKEFISQVLASKDKAAYAKRDKTQLNTGKMGMDDWQAMYDKAPQQLKDIFDASNFNPCREQKISAEKTLHAGYRIDLISVANAQEKAHGMQQDYASIGYQNCKILSPHEVKKIDPYLSDFCDAHSETNESGEIVWKQDASALYRPGGCLDMQTFVPLFVEYLKKRMGKYVSEDGQLKDCFQIHLNKRVTGVLYDEGKPTLATGLKFFDNTIKKNKHAYAKSDYILCPGGAVGTLQSLGFKEPAYAGFAGASLFLDIELNDEQREKFAKFNHCMEVHEEGVVLAWQARLRDKKLFVGVAGTKAFYSDKDPQMNEAFAINRTLLQLNIINQVIPEVISIAFGRDTKGIKLTANDFQYLVNKGIAKPWVGERSVYYDGFPLVGRLHNQHGKVQNVSSITGLGSGGVSLAPVLAKMWLKSEKDEPLDQLSQDFLTYASPTRRA